MKFSPQEFIRQIVGNDRVRVVDIGARKGFDALPKLHSFIEILAVEPERNAVEELKQLYTKMNFSSFQIVQLAIGGHSGEAELKVTQKPSMSSLLEPDFDGYFRHVNRYKHGRAWLEFLKVKEIQKVSLRTLPDLLNEFGWDRVDFLKIDTQGTELEILKSCEALLSQGAISVLEIEVSFVPVYKKQAFFSDIDLFLRRCGYSMVDLRTYPEFVHKMRSTNFSSEVYEPVRYNVFGDAVYVRNSFGTDRKHALLSAFILASAGLFSEADYIIGNDLSHSEKSALFRYVSDEKLSSKFKSGLKRLLPPALLYALYKMKSR